MDSSDVYKCRDDEDSVTIFQETYARFGDYHRVQIVQSWTSVLL